MIRSAWRGLRAVALGGPCVLAALAALPVAARAQVNVLTYHNDAARTGQNLAETLLTTANVNAGSFGRLFVHKVDGEVYAQPLYVSSVWVPGKGSHNVVYVATENDSVYAFDADFNGGINHKPLWKRTLRPKGEQVVPSKDVFCDDLTPRIGITSTPVIDKATGTLYVVARTESTHPSGTFIQRLYALDIATGADKLGGPVELGASVPGTGDGSNGGTSVPYFPQFQHQRAGLLLSGGVVYIASASHCDIGPYHGWILGYNATTLLQVSTFNATPNGGLGGIWQSGCGPSADSGGRLYVVTGNGTFDANTGGADLGDSVIAVNANLTLHDWFTPFNQQQLADDDLDLGSSGALVMPNQAGLHPHELLACGKEGTLYLIDRDAMGHFHAIDNSQIVQVLTGALGGGAYDMPAYFDGKVYYQADGDVLRVFSISNGLLSTQPVAQSATAFGFPGATPSISANGSAEGIVWVLQRDVGAKAPWRLHAYDAEDVSVELYDSGAQGSKDFAGQPVKFAVPTIANGKVYVGASNRLVVFGLK